MQVDLRTPQGSLVVKENILDRVIRYVSPIRGRRRFQARVLTAIGGGYIAGSKARRALKEWVVTGNDPNSDILPDLPLIRERSRDLVRNNPLATGILLSAKTNIIGSGLKLQSRIDRKTLGMNEDEASELERTIESEFKLWAETQECDIGRMLTFSDLQELAFGSTLESGDSITLMPYVKRPGSPYSLRLQLIEGDRLSNADDQQDTDLLYGGILRETTGAPAEYHIQDQHPGAVATIGKKSWKRIKAFGQNTGRRNVIHLMDQTRPGQARGVPYLAPVIEPLKQLGRFTEAELMATVLSSFLTVFVKTASGDAELDPQRPTSEIGGSKTDEDFKLGQGAIIGLGADESIETVNPTRPNQAFDPFVQAILRQVGVALGLPYEVLIKHFTSSYSAARASLLDAWKFFTKKRKWFATHFCDVVFETWMWEAVALGRVSAPGFASDPMLRKAYLGADWVGPSKGMIDELKEILAAEKRVGLGVSTLSQITAELTGGDWEKNQDQRAKENKKIRESGGSDDPTDKDLIRAILTGGEK